MAIKLRLPRRRFLRVRDGQVELVLGLLAVTLLEARAQASEAPVLNPVENQPEPPEAAAASALPAIDLDAVRTMSVDELKALLTPELLAQLGLSADFAEQLDIDLKDAMRELEGAFRKKLQTAAASKAAPESDGESHEGGKAASGEHDVRASTESDGHDSFLDGVSPLLIIGGLAFAGGAVILALSGGDDADAAPVQPNRAPAATNDTFTTNEDAAVTFDVRTNDTDPDGNALTVTQINGTAITTTSPVTIAGVGTVSLGADGRLTFTPVANYNGAPTFTYTVSDGNGGTATGTVTGTVTAINDAPVAVADTFTVAEDGSVTINVRANDTDVEGNALTITHVNGTAITVTTPVTLATGIVALTATGQLTFTPNAHYNGAATFTYTVSDGNGGTSTATVTGTVTSVNDAPVATNDTFTIAEDGTVTFDVRANDTDIDGDALTVTHINGTAITTATGVAVTGGMVTLGTNGQLTFTPTANYNGAPTFTYTVSDGQGGSSTASVSGTVTAVADAPVNATPAPINATSGAPVLIAGLGISDPDGTGGTFTTTLTISNGALTVGSVPGGATITGSGTGTVTISGTMAQVNAALGLVSYTSGVGFSGAATLTMTTSDGALSDTDTFGVAVGAVQNGIVQDGYIEGAQVFYDANGNGQHDEGEPIAFTDAQGRYSLAIPDGATGNVIALGGTNVDTGLPNHMPLKAPVGATVVNPLTTLVADVLASGGTVAEANAKVAASLGLPAGTDFTNTDFLSGSVDPVLALAVQKQAAMVAQLVTDAIEKGVDPAALIKAMSDAADAGTPVDLTKPSALANLLVAAGAPAEVADQVAIAAASVNQQIEAATDPSKVSAVQGEYNQPGANLAPVTEDDTIVIAMGGENDLWALDNDVDPEMGAGHGSGLEMISFGGQSVNRSQVVFDLPEGQLTADYRGYVHFIGNPGFIGTITVEYVVSDEAGKTSIGSLTVRATAPGPVLEVPAAQLDAYAQFAAGQASEGVTGYNVAGGPASVSAANVAALAAAGIGFTEASDVTVAVGDAGFDAAALAAVNVDHIDVIGDAITLSLDDAQIVIDAGIDFVDSDMVTVDVAGTHVATTLKGLQTLNVDTVMVTAGTLVIDAGVGLADITADSLPQFTGVNDPNVTLNFTGGIDPDLDIAPIADALAAAGVDHLGGDFWLSDTQVDALANAGIDIRADSDLGLYLDSGEVHAHIATPALLTGLDVDHIDVTGDAITLDEAEAGVLIAEGIDFVDADQVTVNAGTTVSTTLKDLQTLNVDTVMVTGSAIVIEAGASLGDISADDLPLFTNRAPGSIGADTLDVTLNIAGGSVHPEVDFDAFAQALANAGIDHINSANGFALTAAQAAALADAGIDFTASSAVTLLLAPGEQLDVATLAAINVDEIDYQGAKIDLSEGGAQALIDAGIDFVEEDQVVVHATGTHPTTTLKDLAGLNVDVLMVSGSGHVVVDAGGSLADLAGEELPTFELDPGVTAGTDLDVTVSLASGGALDPNTDFTALAQYLQLHEVDHLSVAGNGSIAMTLDQALSFASAGLDFAGGTDVTVNLDLADIGVLTADPVGVAEFGMDHLHLAGGAGTITDGDASALVAAGVDFVESDSITVQAQGTHLGTSLKDLQSLHVDSIQAVTSSLHLDAGNLDDLDISGLPQFDVAQSDGALDVTLRVDAGQLDALADLAAALRAAGIDHFSVDQPLNSYDTATQQQMQDIATASGIDFVYEPVPVSSMSFLSSSGLGSAGGDDGAYSVQLVDASLIQQLTHSFDSSTDHGVGGEVVIEDGALSSLAESGMLRAYTADTLVLDGTASGHVLLTTLKEIIESGVDYVRVTPSSDPLLVDSGLLADGGIHQIQDLIRELAPQSGGGSIFSGQEKVALVVEYDVAHAMSQVEGGFEKLAAVGFTQLDVLLTDANAPAVQTDALDVKLIGPDSDQYWKFHHDR